jgi:hypothetical protein
MLVKLRDGPRVPMTIRTTGEGLRNFDQGEE